MLAEEVGCGIACKRKVRLPRVLGLHIHISLQTRQYRCIYGRRQGKVIQATFRICFGLPSLNLLQGFLQLVKALPPLVAACYTEPLTLIRCSKQTHRALQGEVTIAARNRIAAKSKRQDAGLPCTYVMLERNSSTTLSLPLR